MFVGRTEIAEEQHYAAKVTMKVKTTMGQGQRCFSHEAPPKKIVPESFLQELQRSCGQTDSRKNK